MLNHLLPTHLPKTAQAATRPSDRPTPVRPIKVRYILPLALGLLSMMPIKPVLAEEMIMRTLTVTGQGSETIATSLTQVQLGVEVQDDTAAEVQQEVARPRRLWCSCCDRAMSPSSRPPGLISTQSTVTKITDSA